MVAGAVAGKIRALVDDRGARLKEAGPSTPVEILGLPSLPEPGDQLLGVTDQLKAQSIVNFRQLKMREKALAASARVRLEDLGRAIAEGQLKELLIVLKADVQGSLEAVADQLNKLPQEKIKVRIIRQGVGAVTEGDVLLAAASNAVVIGFNVRPERKAAEIAERDEVELRLYTIIYDVAEEMKKAMEGLLEPTIREVRLGAAEVRDTFKISKVGTIAGCFVQDGKVTRVGAGAAAARQRRDPHREGQLAEALQGRRERGEVRPRVRHRHRRLQRRQARRRHRVLHDGEGEGNAVDAAGGSGGARRPSGRKARFRAQYLKPAVVAAFGEEERACGAGSGLALAREGERWWRRRSRNAHAVPSFL